MSTALVALAPIDRDSAATGSERPRADFLAQLIATSGQAPQTRARRRAEPQEAMAAYGLLGQWPTRPGVLIRSI